MYSSYASKLVYQGRKDSFAMNEVGTGLLADESIIHKASPITKQNFNQSSQRKNRQVVMRKTNIRKEK
jgi:hypothetical protein